MDGAVGLLVVPVAEKGNMFFTPSLQMLRLCDFSILIDAIAVVEHTKKPHQFMLNAKLSVDLFYSDEKYGPAIEIVSNPNVIVQTKLSPLRTGRDVINISFLSLNKPAGEGLITPHYQNREKSYLPFQHNLVFALFCRF